jgi:hypothetical protein
MAPPCERIITTSWRRRQLGLTRQGQRCSPHRDVRQSLLNPVKKSQELSLGDKGALGLPRFGRY